MTANKVEELEKKYKELKETTAQLVQSAKLSALGELISGMGHELNQPLNTIQIIAQSLLIDIRKNRMEADTLQQDLEDITCQVSRMAETIDNMRAFTMRAAEDVIEAVCLNKIVQKMLQFLGQQLQKHGIEVKRDLCVDMPMVMGNEALLLQVFLNLMSNAGIALQGCAKAGKAIEMKSYVVSADAGPAVVVEVSDNGPGIAADAMERIFELFYTTWETGKGPGLGLPISKKIIEKYRGRIEVDSEVGQGATFRVVLPAIDAKADDR